MGHCWLLGLRKRKGIEPRDFISGGFSLSIVELIGLV